MSMRMLDEADGVLPLAQEPKADAAPNTETSEFEGRAQLLQSQQRKLSHSSSRGGSSRGSLTSSGSKKSKKKRTASSARASGGGRRLTLRVDECSWSDQHAGSFSPTPSSLALVNSTTCLVSHRIALDNDADQGDEITSSGKLPPGSSRKKADSTGAGGRDSTDSDTVLHIGDDPRGVNYTTLSPLPSKTPAGSFRYLKPDEIMQGRLPHYDFALIANRSVQRANAFCQWLNGLCCCGSEHNNERMGFSRLCMSSHISKDESEDEHRRIVDKLCGQGLMVDIIDGGHSQGEMNSAYFILLIRASDEVVNGYVKRFRYQLWREHGAVIDMTQDLIEQNELPTPAERVQIVDYMIEQRANLSKRDPWIHDMFPMHNRVLTDKLISRWVASWRVFDFDDKKILKALRYNFGEKVSYYFAFINYYNRALIPIAVAGLVMQLLHGLLPTVTYMRILPFWGIGVSVVWAFTFLKSWERRNATMQYEWNKKIHVKQIEYPNKLFYGDKKVNSLTGEMEIVYPSYRRLPKYLCVMLFMLFQTAIMLVLVAIWITIYELLKAKYTVSHIFSTQWFLILLEGIVFGLFVDVIQWNMVVTKMAALFTHWENYRTEEQYERALIRKLFLLDFLNYYTWFFSLAFVFVIPGFGDYLMNTLNHTFFGDAMNCCFGPYVDQHGVCTICPIGPKDADCIECVGYFTFDRHHVDLSAMFVTPIVITQSLNIVLGLFMPMVVRKKRERAQARADAVAQKRVLAAGSMKILGSLDYDNKKQSQFGNKSHARYLEYTPSEIEVLNKKAREILFDSEQDSYDPYDDFHALTVQFGFTVMFSILWPLMPVVCFLINTLKRRTDGYRLCKTLKRPIPRKANGIGAWRGIMSSYAYIAVIVNVLLICISTGALEFFDESCVRDIEHQLAKRGKTMDDFILGPDFGCLHIAWRLLIILLLEHVLLGLAYCVMARVPRVPHWIQQVMSARENQFKELLRTHETQLFHSPSTSGKPRAASRQAGDTYDYSAQKGVLLSESRLPLDGFVESARALNNDAVPRSISLDSIMTPHSDQGGLSSSDLEEPSSNGFRSKAREQLARKWSVESDQM